MEQRESFIFYRSFYEALQEVDTNTRAQVLNAICEYSFGINKNPKLQGVALALWKLIEPQLAANVRRYENGKKGGAPKGNTNAKKQPKNNRETTEKQPNVNYNVNGNVNNNDILHSTLQVSRNINTREETDADFYAYVTNSQEFVETTAMNFHISAEDVRTWLAKFEIERRAKNTIHADANDYRRHAFDWIRIQIEKQNKQNNNGKPTSDDNVRAAIARQEARLAALV